MPIFRSYAMGTCWAGVQILGDLRVERRASAGPLRPKAKPCGGPEAPKHTSSNEERTLPGDLPAVQPEPPPANRC